MNLAFNNTQNFTRDEIKADLHPFLMMFLQSIRAQVDVPIKVTRTISGFDEHANIYKSLYKEDWHEHITLGTGHQAQIYPDGSISPYAHAVDFVFLKHHPKFDNIEKMTEFLQQSAEMLKTWFPKEATAFGLGVGKTKYHLDCALWRNSIATWTY